MVGEPESGSETSVCRPLSGGIFDEIGAFLGGIAVAVSMFFLTLGNIFPQLASGLFLFALAGVALFVGFNRSRRVNWVLVDTAIVLNAAAKEGSRIGIIVLLGGGSAFLVCAALKREITQFFLAIGQSHGQSILVVALSSLPVIFAGALGSYFAAKRRLLREAETCEDRPDDVSMSQGSGFLFVAVAVFVLSLFSPNIVPQIIKLRQSSPVVKNTPFEKEVSHPEVEQEKVEAPEPPQIPPFEFVEDPKFEGASPTEWRIVAIKNIEDISRNAPVLLSDDGRFLAFFRSSSRGSGVTVFDLDRNDEVHNFRVPSPEYMVWSPDQSRLFCITNSGERKGWVLDLEAKSTVPLPLVGGAAIPNAEPVWWAESEVAFFPGDVGARWLDLESLRVNPIESSPEFEKSGLPVVDRKSDLADFGGTPISRFTISNQILSYRYRRLGIPEWEFETQPKYVVVGDGGAPLTIFRGVPFSPSDRVLVSKSGSKLIVVKGDKAEVFYLGVREKPEQRWATAEGATDYPESPSQVLAKHLENQTLCAFVCPPVINPLNKKVVGGDVTNVKALVRVLDWNPERMVISVAEDYLPVLEGDILTDLHYWNQGKPIAVEDEKLESWWKELRELPSEFDAVGLKTDCGIIQRGFDAEITNERGLMISKRLVPRRFEEIARVDPDEPDDPTRIAPPTGVVLEDKIRKFVVEHHKKVSEKDLGGFTADYGPSVRHYNKGSVSPAAIREGQATYFSNFKNISETVNGSVSVDQVGEDLFRAIYHLHLRLQKPTNEIQVKLVEVTLDVSARDDLKIVAESSKPVPPPDWIGGEWKGNLIPVRPKDNPEFMLKLDIEKDRSNRGVFYFPNGTPLTFAICEIDGVIFGTGTLNFPGGTTYIEVQIESDSNKLGGKANMVMRSEDSRSVVIHEGRVVKR